MKTKTHWTWGEKWRQSVLQQGIFHGRQRPKRFSHSVFISEASTEAKSTWTAAESLQNCLSACPRPQPHRLSCSLFVATPNLPEDGLRRYGVALQDARMHDNLLLKTKQKTRKKKQPKCRTSWVIKLCRCTKRKETLHWHNMSFRNKNGRLWRRALWLLLKQS